MTPKINQPKGMYVLAFTEVFERFSYYTLAFLLVLYASSSHDKGGLGWSNEKALELVGIYTLAAYTLPILGSYLADDYIGKGKAVIFGGITIILGHFFMLFSKNESIFYLALFCVALGTGFFKPCMPSLLGDLYKTNDNRRESGFSWYYLGINIGEGDACSAGATTPGFICDTGLGCRDKLTGGPLSSGEGICKKVGLQLNQQCLGGMATESNSCGPGLSCQDEKGVELIGTQKGTCEFASKAVSQTSSKKAPGEVCTVLEGGNSNTECVSGYYCQSSTQKAGSAGKCVILP